MISLRSSITQKLLNYFFINPDEERYVNDLARKLKVDPKNLSNKLKELEKEGLFCSENKGQEKYYRLNTKFPLFNEYKSIVLKTVGIEFILKEALGKIRGVKEAYLFGSYAKNNMDSGSDIDLLVIGSQSALEVQKITLGIMNDIGREVNVIDMDCAEFEERKKKDDFFIKEIFSGPTIKLV